MAYFEVVLDTIGPSVEIITPSYILSSADLDIRVQGNEELDGAFQSFRLIDSLGQTHTFILSHYGEYFKGTVQLENIPLGIARIEVQVRDNVHNLSPVVTKSINIIKGARVHITPNTKIRTIKTKNTVREITSLPKTKTVNSSLKSRGITVTSKTRTIRAVVK